MELADILRREATRPGFQIRDAVKLLYQSEFGGGHLLRDPEAARNRLFREMAECAPTDEPPVTVIGGGIARLNLYPASKMLSPDTVFRLFALSSERRRGDLESFRAKLPLIYGLGFEKSAADAFLREYAEAGCPMLSHSETYRQANRPAYRVVLWEYARYLDVFAALDRLPRPALIGIDGMCASGKSTLGRILAEVYDGDLFHADDYFLPPEMRTPERLSAPGGNMHRERLRQEILLPLSRGEKAVTRRFDCGAMTLEPPVEHEKRDVNIVEGSYSLHPELRRFYDLKIALRTDPDTQLVRLRDRDPERISAFTERWIPLENEYFAATDLFDDADVTVET